MKMLSNDFDSALRGGQKLRNVNWAPEEFIYLMLGTSVSVAVLRDCAHAVLKDKGRPSAIVPKYGSADSMIDINAHIDKYLGAGKVEVGWRPNVFEMLSDWEIVP